MAKRELYEGVYKSKLTFTFGKNWKKYLTTVDREKIDNTRKYMQFFLRGNVVKDKTFVDIGSGSGIHSLSAFDLGARKVLSFDVDENCVLCTKALRKKYAKESKRWEIKHGSILDDKFVSSLGQFDIVYSWGVLHHTGDMWKAIDNAMTLVKPGGLYYIAIYNERRGLQDSEFWVRVKRRYSKSGPFVQWLMRTGYMLQFHTVGLLKFENRFKVSRSTNSARGMVWYYDMLDWMGGYPYEYASVQRMVRYVNEKGFVLLNLKDSRNGLGCNEFLFQKV